MLLENRAWKNSPHLKTLPLNPKAQGIKKIALIGPFGDILNYGDYSGSWGAYPVPPPDVAAKMAGTLREGILKYLSDGDVGLVTSVGANTWHYNAQYGVPSYLLTPPDSAHPPTHGLLATYYASTNFTNPRFSQVETPLRDWGLYPPFGVSSEGDPVVLPSNNFSVVWEGYLELPRFSDANDRGDLNFVDGFIGVATSANTTSRLFIDSKLVSSSSYPPFETLTFTTGTILSTIPSLDYSSQHPTSPPPSAGRFRFEGGRKYQVRIEYQAWNLAVKQENVNSLNAVAAFWWNLVDQGAEVDSLGAVHKVFSIFAYGRCYSPARIGYGDRERSRFGRARGRRELE